MNNQSASKGDEYPSTSRPGSVFRDAFALWRKARQEKSVSLQFRLFAFFALFVFVLATAFTIVAMALGLFGEVSLQCQQWMLSETDRLAASASAEFGRLALHGADYAEALSADIEAWLKKNGTLPESIADHPELLEDLLSAQAGGLINLMLTNNCTGAFVILEATVNPSLPNSATSKAGMFFKRTEQNPVSAVKSRAFYLRGPASISRETGIEMIGLWRMEFDVSDYGFYRDVMAQASKGGNSPAFSRYYWASRASLDQSREAGMLLCVPLTDSGGKVFGMCGLEVSPMLFKILYSPDNSLYPHVFTLFAPASGWGVDADSGLVAGNSYVSVPQLGLLRESDIPGSSAIAFSGESGDWVGMNASVKLYPSSSPYRDLSWQLAVLMPKEDYVAYIAHANGIVFLALGATLIVCLALAYLLSQRTIRPVIRALHSITSQPSPTQGDEGAAAEERGTRPKTRIAEIDDLLEFLAAQDEKRAALEVELETSRNAQSSLSMAHGIQSNAPVYDEPDLSAYREFTKNIATLSRAERAVFDLYMKGHSAKEISDILCISMNTTKTHNRHIYTKLNVASRKELMVYVQMMSAGSQDEQES